MRVSAGVRLPLRSPLLALLLSTLFFVACEPTLENRLEVLVAAKNQWVNEVGCQPYSYEIQANGSSWRRVLITDPCREPIDWINDAPKGDFGRAQFEPTMPELFNISLELTQLYHEDGGKLEIEFDDTLGYPIRISWDNRQGSHSSITWIVRNLNIVKAGA